MDSSEAVTEMTVLMKAGAHLRGELSYLAAHRKLSLESLLLIIVELLQER